MLIYKMKNSYCTLRYFYAYSSKLFLHITYIFDCLCIFFTFNVNGYFFVILYFVTMFKYVNVMVQNAIIITVKNV